MKIEDVDLKLEKLVFLLNAEEENPGIYELTWELGYYDLTIEDKYKIARMLLTEIIMEDLVVLNMYKDHTQNEMLESITKHEIDKLLNNPSNWYPSSNLAIEITERGIEFLTKEMIHFGNRIKQRLFKL